MELRIVGFSHDANLQSEIAFDVVDDLVRENGAEPIRHWTQDEYRYVVVRGATDASAMVEASGELPVQIFGVGRFQLPEEQAVQLPTQIGFDPGLRADEPAVEIDLTLCMGCGVPLPASPTEHLARNCQLFAY